MTYFGFLARFLVPPLVILLALTYGDYAAKRTLPPALRSWPARFVLLAHVLVAVLYTTPWDNYLVATDVWWYNPHWVSGIVLGWVPLEEYIFFVLQTILTGLWVLWLAKRLPVAAFSSEVERPALRWWSAGFVGLCWLGALGLWLSGWQPGVYLTLILLWALIPIFWQLLLGGDILWHYRRLVLWALLPVTGYLGLGDTFAIRAGTWTIDPAQSTGLFLGALPLEELLFFLVTNTLVVFGMILVLAQASQTRAPKALLHILRRGLQRPAADGASLTIHH